MSALPRAALTAIALLALGALAALALDAGGTLRLGPIRVTLNAVGRPLAWGTACLIVLLVADRTHRRRRTAHAALLLVTLALGALAFARTAAPIVTTADFSLTELYTQLASEGRLLLGPYSRFGWNHPGPLYFYLQAPLYVLSGHQAAALFATAAAVNIAALALLVWVPARGPADWPRLAVPAACVIFAWRADWILASPWTAHVPVMSALACAVCCAAAASGRLRLLPLAAAFGTLAVQTHIALAPAVLVLGSALLLGVAAQGANSAPAGGAWRVVNATAWLCLLLWLLPISEAVAGRGGNLAALFRFFAAEPEGAPALREALTSWSHGLTGVLRSDFGLPWGGHIPVHQYRWWALPCAAAQVVLLGGLVAVHRARGRSFDAALAGAALLVTLTGAWAVSRIRGTVADHELFWLSGFGALNLGIIAEAALRLCAGRHVTGRVADAAFAAGRALLALGAAALAIGDLERFTDFEARRSLRSPVLPAYTAISAHLDRQAIRRPLVVIADDVWGHAAGVILRLHLDGRDVAAGAAQHMFTPALRPSGHEDGVVTIGGRPTNHVMSRQPTHLIVEAPPLYVYAGPEPTREP